VRDIFRLRNVDDVLRDALDQIDNLLQTPRHYYKDYVKAGTFRILTHCVAESYREVSGAFERAVPSGGEASQLGRCQM